MSYSPCSSELDFFINLLEEKEMCEKIYSPYKAMREGTMTLAVTERKHSC
jgi:hypothetical protein